MKHIKELNPEDFDVVNGKITSEKLNGNMFLVAFVAEWCGYCKRMLPEYSKAAGNVDGYIDFFIFDCVKHEAFLSNLDVKSFPTIVYGDKDGVIFKKYEADRTAENFLNDLHTTMVKNR